MLFLLYDLSSLDIFIDMKNLLLFSVLSFAQICFAVEKKEPSIEFRYQEKKLTYSRSQLLARPDVTQIRVEKDPAYPGQVRTYTAVPAAALFKDFTVAKDATIQFRCVDGYSAAIDRDKILNQFKKASIAYLAIERADEKWPQVTTHPGVHNITPAPFMLIWENPKASNISIEEWPYQVVGFEVKPSLRVSYPKIYPSEKIQTSNTVYRGFQVFTKNCFTCHTMNGEGDGKVGPDLNLPLNPTEYFSEKGLKTLIRNPRNVRTWPGALMKGFTPEELSDADIQNLISYLHHMKGRKEKVGQ